MGLEKITNNEKEHKDLDLKSLVYKWLEYNLESKRMNSITAEERRKAEEKAEDLFYTILERKKTDIINKLDEDGKTSFISLLNKKRHPYLGLNESEENAIISTSDKEIAYNFFLGYGLFKIGKSLSKSMTRWEKILELAKKNDDITYQGRAKKVIKIKIPFGKKTIIFKKASGEGINDLRLENHVWMYYQWRLNSLLAYKSPWVVHDKEHKHEYYFNLPERLLFDQGVFEETSAYLIWKADSEDLLSKVLKSDDKAKKGLVKNYLKEVAKVDAFGPFNLVPKQKYLITKEAFLERMSQVANKWPVSDLTEKVLESYNVIANSLSKSKVKGVVKDAALKNAAISGSKMTCIDFDKMRVAPLQMDISKLLILSHADRQEFLKEFIQEYNSAAEFFNKNFANKPLFFPYHKKCVQEPEKQKITDVDEFYFTYLNFVVDHSLFVLFEGEYKKEFERLDIRSIQKDNALSAIKELTTKYKNKYNPMELKQLECLSDVFKMIFMV